MSETWDWAAAGAAMPLLLRALTTTMLAGVLGFALALVLGLPLALGRDARRAAIRLPVTAGVEFVRGTPLLIQVYFLYFTLPAAGVVLPALLTGIGALGIHYATYVSEVYRSGLRSVGRGQRDAAAALGLRPRTAFFRVVLPQALPPIFPALGNYALAILKETPILASISVTEMLQEAKLIGAETFRYTEPMTLVGLAFLAVSLVGAAALRYVERRLNRAGS
jgi:polar amino acid transport system permease protein